jgi:alanine dehydrogenase
MPLILTGSDTADLLSFADVIPIARQALIEWAEHEDVNPPRQRVHVQHARASVHPGGSPSEGVLGVHMHGEALRIVGEQQLGFHYPPVCALYDLHSRELLALFLGREGNQPLGTLQRLRTAAISALGTAELARRDARVMALFGSGTQARPHLEAHLAAMPLQEIRVYSPNPEHRAAFVERMAPKVEARLEAVDSPEAALDGADVVVAATNTTRPVFDGDTLKPGMHVTTIGGSNIGLIRSGVLRQKRSEVDDATLARADRVVILSARQATQDEQGEIIDPVERGALSWERVFQLRDVLSGKAPGRQGPGEITVFTNNAGTGNVDIAIAGRLYAEAKRRGRGQLFEHPDVTGEHE